MKGGIMTFSGSMIMIMIGIGIIWWFRSVSVSEAFIASERHKESFSTLNYVEFAKKTLEEAVYMDSHIGAAKMGITGGINANKKDDIAIWKTAPDEATIKDALEENISGEIGNSLPETPIPGKFLTTSYSNAKIEITADKSDFAASEKFFVKGEKNIAAKKNLESSGIFITANLKGIIDAEIKLKYFALYDAARRFMDSGQAKARIDAAFASVPTSGTVTHGNDMCGTSVSCAGTVCPTAPASDIDDSEVLASTGYYGLEAAANSISDIMAGSFFHARFDKYGTVKTSAGYNDADATVSAGSCGFECSYQVPNDCKTVVQECTPAEDPEADPVCVDRCVAGYDTITLGCTAETKTKEIDFTFVADMYAKYSSEDPNGFVPSQALKNIAGKTVPYDTLKFNFLTHSCSTIKGGAISTELKDDASDCTIATGHTL